MILGQDVKTGEDFEITPKDRKTHMHIVGNSGLGKSKFLEMMIQKDILNGEGLCLLDPHGSLYNNITKWIETHHLWDKRKIILFDPLEERYSFAFNPLQLSGRDITAVVGAMIKACATVWGEEDPDKLPLLQRSLTAVFHALIEKRLTLYEAQHLINTEDPAIRLYLTHDLEDPIAEATWKDFNKKSVKDLDNDFLSIKNRLLKFLRHKIIRTIFGQVQDTIDFYKIMEEGYILLVNLNPSSQMEPEGPRLLGAMIINELFLNCLRREENPDRPFYLYVDEAGDYVTKDIPRILEQGRKFGLHLILSHQHLYQLQRIIGEDGFKSVMIGGQTKVVFGGLDYEDAKILVNNIFLGQLDLQEWKEKLTRPTVVGYERTTFRHSSHSRGSVFGTSHTDGQGESECYPTGAVPGAGGIIFPGPQSQKSISITKTDGDFYSDSESETEGESEGIVPIFRDLPIKEYSLEEQKERHAAWLVAQPIQHAIMKLPSQKAQFIKTPNAEIPWASDERVEASKEEQYLSTRYIKARIVVEQEIKQRQNLLKLEAKKFIDQQKNPPAPDPVEINPTTGEAEEVKETFKEPQRRRRKI